MTATGRNLRCLALLAGVALPATAALAQTTPANPGGAPRAAGGAPSTQPAPHADATSAAAARVLVLPLAEVSDGATKDWIGRAMQQSMLAELARMRFVEPVTPRDGQAKAPDAPLDAPAAANEGRQAGAEFVVFGSYQVMGEDLRVTGQVVDVASGSVLGGIKATGNVRDLFGIEDILAGQLRRELATAVLPPDPQQPAGGGGQAAAAPNGPFAQQPQQQQPQQPTAQQPAVAPSGPVTSGRGGTGYEGSALERALNGSNAEQAAAYDRYRNQPPVPAYYPPYGYRYPYGYDYYPYAPHRDRDVIIIDRGNNSGGGGGVIVTPGKTGAGEPMKLPPNGNFNTAPSGGGGGGGGKSSGGNSIQGKPGGGVNFNKSNSNK